MSEAFLLGLCGSEALMKDSMAEGKENQSISPALPQVVPPEASSSLWL